MNNLPVVMILSGLALIPLALMNLANGESWGLYIGASINSIMLNAAYLSGRD